MYEQCGHMVLADWQLFLSHPLSLRTMKRSAKVWLVPGLLRYVG